MNDPDACHATFHLCRCELPAGHDGAHECVPDPVCGGSWLRHPDDDAGMIRVFRYPGNRPGCEPYAPPDPEPGEHVLEWDGIPRVPRDGIGFLPPPAIMSVGWPEGDLYDAVTAIGPASDDKDLS
jgi:hypothetical protein